MARLSSPPRTRSRAGSSTSAADRDVVVALNREWTTLREEPVPWAPSLTAGAVLEGIGDDPDARLLALVTHCQDGHALAGRIVVQALMGRLVVLASCDTRVGCDDLVAALWLRLATYPVTRRPRAVASNLTLDARKDVLREHRVLQPVPGPEPADPLTAHDMLRAASVLRLVSDETAKVMGSVYGDGLTSRDAGTRHGLTPEAVRWRCSHGVRVMRRRRFDLLDLCS